LVIVLLYNARMQRSQDFHDAPLCVSSAFLHLI